MDELKELENKIVNIGVDSLISTEMSPDEKESIMEEVISSVENLTDDDYEETNRILAKIAGNAYKKIISSFSAFDEEKSEDIKAEYEDFKDDVKNDILDQWPWDDLIEYVEDLKEILSELRGKEEKPKVIYSRELKPSKAVDLSIIDNMTPQDAEAYFKEQKKVGIRFTKNDYSYIMDKIGLQYEEQLLEELNYVKPEDIYNWMEITKESGKHLTRKVWDRAMDIHKTK